MRKAGRIPRELLAAAILCTAAKPASTWTQCADDGGIPLAIVIDNMAQCPAAVLANAQREAARVLRHAAIDIRWLECPDRQARPHQQPRCGLPSDIPAFTVELLAKVEAERWTVPRDTTLGFSLASNVYVLFPRLEALADREAVRLSTILGYVIAHEIGHGLLGTGHSAQGLMRSEVNLPDWRSVEKGQLLFTSGQAQALRREIRRRTRALQAGVPSRCRADAR
jgi:hypothetical protein